MTTTSTNLGLTLFNSTTDATSQSFLQYRTAVAGTGATSNFQILDALFGVISVDLVNGRVGIGTTSPESTLTVNGVIKQLGSPATTPRQILYDDGTSASYVIFTVDAFTRYKSNSSFVWMTVPSGANRLTDAGTEIFRTNGTSLNVVGDITAGGSFVATGALQSTNVFPLYVPNMSSAAGTPLQLNANGYVYANTSSEKTKKNIERSYEFSEDEVSSFLSVKPIRFEYLNDDDGVNQISFSAEEINKAGLNQLLNYNLVGEPWSLREMSMISMLHQIVVKHNKEIEDIKSRL